MPDPEFGGVSPEVFADRRERVLARLGKGAMVLPAAPPLLRSGDSELPYRPDSELFYLTGFREPGALLVLRGFADEDRAVLFVQPRDPESELWTGPRLGPDRVHERVGIETGRSSQTLAQDLPGLLAGADRVHFRLGVHPAVESLVAAALRHARARGSRTGSGPRGVVDPGEILDELRLRKDPSEVEALREAARITALGVRAAMEAAAPGVGEWELQAVVEEVFRREGASGPAFATIVASGRNACVLHYVANESRIAEGDLVLVDAGAEARMYAGDMSRAFPASGRLRSEQADLYDAVEAARARATAAIRPGATVGEVHETAVRTLVEGMVGLGILRGDPDELIAKNAHKAFFPHRTSHWLGLDAHDPGDYVKDGGSRVLEEGMVLTVEPGLYFPPLDRADPATTERSGDAAGENAGDAAVHFRGVGIRIEDTVLVTPRGAENLTSDVPTERAAVAELIGRAR